MLLILSPNHDWDSYNNNEIDVDGGIDDDDYDDNGDNISSCNSVDDDDNVAI